MMNMHHRFFSTATLAKAVGKSPITIERALRAQEISADAVVETPRGRELALFSEKTLAALLLDETPPTKI